MSIVIPETTIDGRDALVIADNSRNKGPALIAAAMEAALQPMRVETFRRAQNFYQQIASDKNDSRRADLPVFAHTYDEEFVDWYLAHPDAQNADGRHKAARIPQLESEIAALEAKAGQLEERIAANQDNPDSADAVEQMELELTQTNAKLAAAETELADLQA